MPSDCGPAVCPYRHVDSLPRIFPDAPFSLGAVFLDERPRSYR